MADGVYVCGDLVRIIRSEKPPFQHTMSFLIPISTVKYVIGKDHFNIKKIAKFSHCRIEIKNDEIKNDEIKNDEINDEEVLVTITCVAGDGLSNANILTAFWAIAAIVRRIEPMFACGHRSPPGQYFSTEFELSNDYCTLKITNIPQSALSIIIGRSGHTVKNIATFSHVDITVKENIEITSRFDKFNVNVAYSNPYVAFWACVAAYYYSVVRIPIG